MLFVEGLVLHLTLSFLINHFLVIYLSHRLFVVFIPLLICFDVADHINICSVNIFEGSHSCVHSDSKSTIDSNHLDSITRLHVVN